MLKNKNKTKSRKIRIKSKKIRIKSRKIRIKSRKIRIKREKYNKIGGFVNQQVINMPYNENLMETINTSFAPIFELIPTFSKDLIYVSFGSKLNETTLEREYLDMNYYTTANVNAAYQMVPFFLCSNSHPRQNMLCDGRPCKVLNIVIDIFNDEEQIDASKRYIEESLSSKIELDAPLDTSNITQIFVNIINVKDGIIQAAMAKGQNPFTVEEQYTFLGMIADTLCKKARENNIQPTNLMVVNYIKFKHANPAEAKLGTDVSKTLEKNMTDNGYENSYYEWLAYNRMVFYNCIVLKKYIDVVELGFAFAKFSVFKGSEKNQLKVFELSKSEFKKGEEKFRDILKYVYPIKNPYYDMVPETGYPEDRFNNFCYSLYDLMKE